MKTLGAKVAQRSSKELGLMGPIVGSHCRLSQSQERAYALGTIAGEVGVGQVCFADRLSQSQERPGSLDKIDCPPALSPKITRRMKRGGELGSKGQNGIWRFALHWV
ncbi:hypothetical protein MRB53_002137 [Persea americana]|uniref:Uncharacterized protein n=1 Tax=Persea americana TaxID=3435 RepID=A0ACC2MTW5_PERAE|nr:hypothetical protein MRB53_002137 [Persea americana]